MASRSSSFRRGSRAFLLPALINNPMLIGVSGRSSRLLRAEPSKSESKKVDVIDLDELEEQEGSGGNDGDAPPAYRLNDNDIKSLEELEGVNKPIVNRDGTVSARGVETVESAQRKQAVPSAQPGMEDENVYGEKIKEGNLPVYTPTPSEDRAYIQDRLEKGGYYTDENTVNGNRKAMSSLETSDISEKSGDENGGAKPFVDPFGKTWPEMIPSPDENAEDAEAAPIPEKASKPMSFAELGSGGESEADGSSNDEKNEKETIRSSPVPESEENSDSDSQHPHHELSAEKVKYWKSMGDELSKVLDQDMNGGSSGTNKVGTDAFSVLGLGKMKGKVVEAMAKIRKSRGENKRTSGAKEKYTDTAAPPTDEMASLTLELLESAQSNFRILHSAMSYAVEEMAHVHGGDSSHHARTAVVFEKLERSYDCLLHDACRECAVTDSVEACEKNAAAMHSSIVDAGGNVVGENEAERKERKSLSSADEEKLDLAASSTVSTPSQQSESKSENSERKDKVSENKNKVNEPKSKPDSTKLLASLLPVIENLTNDETQLKSENDHFDRTYMAVKKDSAEKDQRLDEKDDETRQGKSPSFVEETMRRKSRETRRERESWEDDERGERDRNKRDRHEKYEARVKRHHSRSRKERNLKESRKMRREMDRDERDEEDEELDRERDDEDERDDDSDAESLIEEGGVERDDDSDGDKDDSVADSDEDVNEDYGEEEDSISHSESSRKSSRKKKRRGKAERKTSKHKHSGRRHKRELDDGDNFLERSGKEKRKGGRKMSRRSEREKHSHTRHRHERDEEASSQTHRHKGRSRKAQEYNEPSNYDEPDQPHFETRSSRNSNAEASRPSSEKFHFPNPDKLSVESILTQQNQRERQAREPQERQRGERQPPPEGPTFLEFGGSDESNRNPNNSDSNPGNNSKQNTQSLPDTFSPDSSGPGSMWLTDSERNALIAGKKISQSGGDCVRNSGGGGNSNTNGDTNACANQNEARKLYSALELLEKKVETRAKRRRLAMIQRMREEGRGSSKKTDPDYMFAKGYYSHTGTDQTYAKYGEGYYSHTGTNQTFAKYADEESMLTARQLQESLDKGLTKSAKALGQTLGHGGELAGISWDFVKKAWDTVSKNAESYKESMKNMVVHDHNIEEGERRLKENLREAKREGKFN